MHASMCSRNHPGEGQGNGDKLSDLVGDVGLPLLYELLSADGRQPRSFSQKPFKALGNDLVPRISTHTPAGHCREFVAV